MIMTQYKTKHYRIQIFDQKYQIANNATGVVEQETSMLPEALDVMEFLTKSLEERLNPKQESAQEIETPEVVFHA